MDEATASAATDIEKERVALWDASIWSYMRAGRDAFVRRMSSPMPELVAPRVPDAGGDPAKVAWDKAATLGDTWYARGGAEPPSLSLGGRVCHDGTMLYVELTDDTDPARLTDSPTIAPYDVWELILARQRAQPFRHYLIGPSARIMALSYGEVNWRQQVDATEYADPSYGLKAVSDTSGDRWVVRLAFPLATMSDQPVPPGETVHMNIMRVSSPRLANQPDNGLGIDTWVSHTTVRQVDRLGKITLAP